MHLYKFIHDNPVESVLIVLFWSQVASTMPSPTLTGFTSTWGYKWLFGIMHIFVALPRIIITMLPQFAWIFGANAANREIQATDKKNFADQAAPLDPPPLHEKPTVAELETILREDNTKQVEILPNGQVRPAISPEKK
jgi:hypothetical protein